MYKIFISYSHKDEDWKDRLVTQLGVLQKQSALEIWDDRRIQGGEEWLPEIENALQSANLAILLISPTFLTSNFIMEKEIPLLLERRRKQGIRIFPVIVKPCAWQKIDWLQRLQARPKDGKPLAGMRKDKAESALAALAEEVAKLLKPATATASATASFQPLPPGQIFTAKLPTTSGALFGREKDLRRLDEAWADPHTHILTLVAWGGVGKTALVNEWLNQIARENYRGAERVYGWSFYSQGTREDRQVSADEFLAHGLKWFGDPDPKAGAPWEKGARLAALIRQQKTLLVLDGLEPLQYPPGPLHGQLKDQGAQALLKELASDNAGLCIVTTRVHVADLAHKTKSAVLEGPVRQGSVQPVDLENLSPEAGGQLLRHLGVKGTDAELVEAAAEFHGHALALNLLGSYLATVHEGEVRKRDLIPHLIDKEEQPGYHAYRVMASYEHWLAATPELDLLYLMGLFDRPAAKGAIDALLAPPVIAGLTSNLQNLPFAKLQFVLRRLRDLRLLADGFDSAHHDGFGFARHDTLDCHPLVREHFGEKLRQQHPAAWQEAHSRLYEYYKNLPAKHLPDTLEEMEPLFAAVAHGCQAERFQEAYDEIFFPRIKRKNEYYVMNQLGAFGSSLSTISHFFKNQWSQLVSKLRQDTKAVVLNQAGFSLHALGRLREADQLMQAAIQNFIEQKNWKEAAREYGNLSELYLTLGEVGQAVASARQGVDFADRSGDLAQQFTMRTTWADTLHQSGELTEAHQLFHEAETMQQEGQPEYSYLYSLWGFRFCDLLLSQRQYQEVQKRASQTVDLANQAKHLISIALDKLSLGRAFLLCALSEVEAQAQSINQARDHLQQAVAGLREAGRQDILPLGLFARAACYRAQNEFASAWADLEEAREIAERGEMKLHLADYHLEACRLCFAQGEGRKGKGEERGAKEHLAIAKEMIEKMGYGRRKPEVEALRRELEELKI